MTESIQYTITAGTAAGLVREVEAAVAAGSLAPGQPLPSVRRLAAGVGLSPATVATALAELRRRGVVVTEPRRGSRIGDGPPIGGAGALAAAPDGACDLSRGNPDPALLPDLRPALGRLQLPTRLYGEAQAVPGLLERARRALDADGVPSQALCIVSGALDGIERALQAHLRPGDAVAVEDPGYAAMYDLLRAQGLSLVPVALDARGARPRELEAALQRGAKAAILTPRGQNPTGAALDAARAGELRDVLARHPGTLVVEDDHLGPVAGSALHTTVTGARRWAATRSVAKALGPDLRLAILAGDAQTVARVEGRQRCGPGWVSHVLQSLVLALWSDDAVRRDVALARATYARRREALLRSLAANGVAAEGASGLNVWIPVADEAAVVATMLQRGWLLAAGSRYRLRSGPAVRVTIAALDGAATEKLARDLAGVLAPAARVRVG